MGVLDTLTIGKRALGAASAGIEVTSQNVSNASTVGYSRRRLVSTTASPVLRRGLWQGTGAQVTGIHRATDRLLGSRVVATAGAQSAAQTKEALLATAEAYFDEQSATGLHESLASFYDALSALTTDSSDSGVRREAVAAAGVLANTTSSIATNLAGAIDDVDAAAADYINMINEKLAAVATLNRSIGRSGASLGPGDLLDQRDQLVRELGELAGATVDFAADGQATVFLGGHAAVSGREARTLSTSVDTSGVTQVNINVGSGTFRITSSVGGDLGGSLQARDTIQGWLDDLDTFATTLADTFNTQHALGFDANGNPGGDIFTINALDPASSLSVDASLADDPLLLALAGAATADAGDITNLRSMLDIEDSAAFGGLTGSDAVSSLTSLVGTEASAASGDAEVLDAQLEDLEVMRDAVSKVDIDEEAVQLIAFQSAYRAAARVVSASDELLQTLLAIGA